ncbi:substrate-binding domain-containing protein [Verrucomicrobiaceae bacterium N1E253]|uniref:Substrate-binding domain-containing protein n=1 Tax=Oceaniferula marina TaxID=2748318 RepID=A0A851GRL8_9BACT|nr:substrate-binding domain-containing protein [Oceaniferula marina]
MMIQNDYLAVTLLQKLEDLGVRVPEEVAVIGADNDELHCVPTTISITSVDDDLDQIGYTAAQTLDRMMDGEEVSELILVPPKEVVVRSSTDTIAISHEPTAKALAYIRKNFCDSISIDLLAERCGMSRRRLEDAFKKYVGRTMAAEIQRLRHDNVKRFLKKTDLKLNAIAHECGYADGAHLSKSFKKQELITPQLYRLSQR